MNPFELTKDPDGGGITVRVKHGFVVLTCEEERRVTERITEILAENAKLRDDLETQREVATDNMNRNAREYKRVRDENEKLRELASILCFCMQVHKLCDDCKLNGAKGDMAHDPLLACDGLHAMLRELGIEVP